MTVSETEGLLESGGALRPVKQETKPRNLTDDQIAAAQLQIEQHEARVDFSAGYEITNSENHQLVRNPATGNFLPGHPGLPGAGRPPRGQSYRELAAARPTKIKLQVIESMERRAVVDGTVGAAEFLRDTAEGKPATTVIVQESPILDELLQRFAAIDAEYQVMP